MKVSAILVVFALVGAAQAYVFNTTLNVDDPVQRQCFGFECSSCKDNKWPSLLPKYEFDVIEVVDNTKYHIHLTHSTEQYCPPNLVAGDTLTSNNQLFSDYSKCHKPIGRVLASATYLMPRKRPYPAQCPKPVHGCPNYKDNDYDHDDYGKGYGKGYDRDDNKGYGDNYNPHQKRDEVGSESSTYPGDKKDYDQKEGHNNGYGHNNNGYGHNNNGYGHNNNGYGHNNNGYGNNKPHYNKDKHYDGYGNYEDAIAIGQWQFFFNDGNAIFTNHGFAAGHEKYSQGVIVGGLGDFKKVRGTIETSAHGYDDYGNLLVKHTFKLDTACHPPY